MKRHIKISVSLLVYILRLLKKRLGLTTRSQYLTILYYHGVPASKTASFAAQMAILARVARVVSADWQGPPGTDVHDTRQLLTAITFDDAFESVVENALPVLAAHRFPCTIFVPVGHLGRPPGWSMEADDDCDERVATADQLRAVDGNLVAIGSHTVHHPRLSAISDDGIKQELDTSMSALTALFGRKADLLAFPYGDYDERVEAICRASGYRMAFTIHPTQIHPAADAYLRGRVAVDPADGALEFFLKASGSYDWMSYISRTKGRVRRWRASLS